MALVADGLPVEEPLQFRIEEFRHGVLLGRRQRSGPDVCEEAPDQVREVAQPSLLQLTHLTDMGRNSSRAAAICWPQDSQLP